MENRNRAGRASQRYAQANPPSHTTTTPDPESRLDAETQRRRGLTQAEQWMFQENPMSWMLKRTKEVTGEYGNDFTPEEKEFMSELFKTIIADGMVRE